MSLGIAFEGCACRAAFHAGVAQALSESDLPITLTAGASSGSLIAVGMAAGSARELPAVFRSLGGRSILSLRRFRQNRSPFDMSTILRAAITHALGPRIDLRERPIEALVSATRLPDLRPILYSSRHELDLLEPLMGSCFLPFIYGRPVRVRGELIVDGGLVDNLPVEALANAGAAEVIAVVARPSGAALKSPLRPRWRPSVAGTKVHVICPARPLEIRSWDFDRERIDRAVDEGYARGREFLG